MRERQGATSALTFTASPSVDTADGGPLPAGPPAGPWTALRCREQWGFPAQRQALGSDGPMKGRENFTMAMKKPAKKAAKAKKPAKKAAKKR